MLHRIRDQIGTAGLIVAVVALVAALGGGAYAASGLNGKQKKEVKKFSKKFSKQFSKKFAKTGPTGPAGPAGANGANGAKGANGTNGEKGAAGANGTNGTFSTEPLPKGETLTGVWGVNVYGVSAGSSENVLAISYPIQVSPAPTTLLFIFVGEGAFTYNPITGAPGPAMGPPEYEAFCPGSIAEPEAEEGALCLYREEFSNATIDFGAPTGRLASPDPVSGATVPITNEIGGDGYLAGSWAVTAE